MHRILTLTMIIALGLATTWTAARADDDESHEVIEKVMKKAMKGGLCKKVASGKASDAEKQELAKLFLAMSKAKPPKGDAESWKKKSGALYKAAADVAAGKDGAVAALRKAANCKACHSVHRPAQ